MGKRMRPHTLTVPKPLINVAGKPIVQRLVEDIAGLCTEPVDEIAFIIGHFGDAVEQQLLNLATSLGAKGKICYQEEALGTAHAILCAEESLVGKTIIAFADTLFRADFKLETEKDGILWVSQIDDPSAFGVVKVDENNRITDFVEKPQEFVSDLAMIGIYYFRDGQVLKEELNYLIDNNIMNDGEYQLPDALRNMTAKGMHFSPGKVNEWLDCGNKNATVYSNQRVLENIKAELKVPESVSRTNSMIIPPCYIGENVELTNAIVGPHVSLGGNTKLTNTVITNSIIQEGTRIGNSIIDNSMVGAFAKVNGSAIDLSISDYSTVEN